MSSRVPLPQSRVRAHRIRRRKRIAIAVAVLVLVLFAVVVGVAWLPVWRVNMVEVSGTQSVPTSTVVAYVQKQLQGTYAYVFPRSNLLLINKGHIAQNLPVAIPTIKTAEVHVDNLHTLGVRVVERGPVALWCGQAPASSSPCFLLDATGSVYAQSADYSGDVYVHYFGSTTAATLPKQYLTPVQFEGFFALNQTLSKGVGEAVSRVAVSDGGDITMTFAGGFTLIFAQDQSPADVLARFSLAQSSSVFAGHALADFDYLDLRFGDKLYYKLKNAAAVGPAATSTAQ